MAGVRTEVLWLDLTCRRFNERQRLCRRGGDGVQIAEFFVDEGFGEAAVKLRQQVIEISAGVNKYNWFMVKSELLEGENL